jgi:exodeoxyribonuclease VII small subunit
MDNEKFNFEEALKEIEEIVAALEGGKISLEESLKLYERGVKLVREANVLLVEAKNKLNNVNGVIADE